MSRSVFRAILCAALLLAVAAPARAGWDEAVAAYERGDHAAAVRALRPLAERGDARAQYNLGFMYKKGQGVPQDFAEAVRWYRKAAGQGIAEAQNWLAFMYDNGQGVPRDYAEAARWYRKAADQGVAAAQSSPNTTRSVMTMYSLAAFCSSLPAFSRASM